VRQLPGSPSTTEARAIRGRAVGARSAADSRNNTLVAAPPEPPQRDPCAPIAAEVEPRAAIDAIETEIRSLQDQLQFASPSEKRRLRDMIAVLQREQRSTEAVLADAELRLRLCSAPVFNPSP
jgi:hypothetical protein